MNAQDESRLPLGFLQIYLHARGTRRILTLGPGDLFSWSAVIEPRRETETARAIECTEVLGIQGSRLLDLYLEDRALGCEMYKSIAAVVSSRLKATQMQLLDVFAVT